MPTICYYNHSYPNLIRKYVFSEDIIAVSNSVGFINMVAVMPSSPVTVHVVVTVVVVVVE